MKSEPYPQTSGQCGLCLFAPETDSQIDRVGEIGDSMGADWFSFVGNNPDIVVESIPTFHSKSIEKFKQLSPYPDVTGIVGIDSARMVEDIADENIDTEYLPSYSHQVHESYVFIPDSKFSVKLYNEVDNFVVVPSTGPLSLEELVAVGLYDRLVAGKDDPGGEENGGS